MRPRLRDNQLAAWPYAVTATPQSHIFSFAEEITKSAYLGKADIQGDEWGDMFANAVGGGHLASPVGHVDVTKGKLAWSVKTVKDKTPHRKRVIRIISGRNSPDYSFGIKNVHDDIGKTGAAVLSIWNERVRLSISTYKIIPRLSILVRNLLDSTFTYFESDVKEYNPHDYEWKENKRGNFEGIDKSTGRHAFTWQVHGSQFTILYDVPEYAVKFSIKKPGRIDPAVLKKAIGFDKNWVTFR